MIRGLIDEYKINLTKLIENVGICEETDYLPFQKNYDSCKVTIPDSSGTNRVCFISSSFALPLNYKELKEELEDDEPVSKSLLNESSTPLFLSDSREGNKGNAQDEKDETEE